MVIITFFLFALIVKFLILFIIHFVPIIANQKPAINQEHYQQPDGYGLLVFFNKVLRVSWKQGQLDAKVKMWVLRLAQHDNSHWVNVLEPVLLHNIWNVMERLTLLDLSSSHILESRIEPWVPKIKSFKFDFICLIYVFKNFWSF